MSAEDEKAQHLEDRAERVAGDLEVVAEEAARRVAKVTARSFEASAEQIAVALEMVRTERKSRHVAMWVLSGALIVNLVIAGFAVGGYLAVGAESPAALKRESVARGAANCEAGNKTNMTILGLLNALLDSGDHADARLPPAEREATAAVRAESRRIGAERLAPRDCSRLP